MELYILSNAGITECHPNANAVYHSQRLFHHVSLCHLHPYHYCRFPSFLFFKPKISVLSLPLYAFIRFFPLKNYNGDRVFTVFTSLRLICDTQLCQLKPLMVQCSIQRCQSCQLLNITVCCINRLVKEQECKFMKFKRKYGGKYRRDGKAGGLNLV